MHYEKNRVKPPLNSENNIRGFAIYSRINNTYLRENNLLLQPPLRKYYRNDFQW